MRRTGAMCAGSTARFNNRDRQRVATARASVRECAACDRHSEADKGVQPDHAGDTAHRKSATDGRSTTSLDAVPGRSSCNVRRAGPGVPGGSKSHRTAGYSVYQLRIYERRRLLDTACNGGRRSKVGRGSRLAHKISTRHRIRARSSSAKRSIGQAASCLRVRLSVVARGARTAS